MAENPNKPDDGWAKVIGEGIKRVTRDQAFLLVLVLIVLVPGTAFVLALPNEHRLAGVAVLAIGLVGIVLFYQARTRTRAEAQAFDLTITVLSVDGRPVKGALVTVVGPKPLTDKLTNKDGRVVYKYTGDDANSYRNRDVTLTAIHEGRSASLKTPLPSQAGQFVDLMLSEPDVPPIAPPPPVNTLPKAPPAAPQAAQVQQAVNAMDEDLFQRVVQVITPHVSSQGSQSALINRAFFNKPVVNKIQVGQSAADFAGHLVRTLYDFDGNAAIITLLETLRADVGANKQREIDALIDELRG